jgi:hypothetical protein
MPRAPAVRAGALSRFQAMVERAARAASREVIDPR